MVRILLTYIIKYPCRRTDTVRMQQQKKSSGFTLIEVMITTAIIGVVTAIAVPGYLSVLPKMRLQSAARDLYSNLQKAKIRAIKENRNISVRFDNAAPPGYYYFDIDEDTAYTAGEYRVDLGTYNDVDYGSGNATLTWDDGAIVQESIITFSAKGTANSGTVYLENLRNPGVSYAITSQISGAVKMRRYSGQVPFNKNYWK